MNNDYIAAGNGPMVLPATNYYDNASETTFFGPLLTVETQSLDIDPLLTAQGWTKGSISYSSKGLPYLALSADNVFFPLGKLIGIPGLSGLRLGGGFSWELSRQEAQLIQQSTTTVGAWEGAPVTITATTFNYQAKLGYLFDNGSFISLGFGQRQAKNAQEDGPTVVSVRPVYSIKYELHK